MPSSLFSRVSSNGSPLSMPPISLRSTRSRKTEGEEERKETFHGNQVVLNQDVVQRCHHVQLVGAMREKRGRSVGKKNRDATSRKLTAVTSKLREHQEGRDSGKKNMNALLKIITAVNNSKLPNHQHRQQHSQNGESIVTHYYRHPDLSPKCLSLLARLVQALLATQQHHV